MTSTTGAARAVLSTVSHGAHGNRELRGARVYVPDDRDPGQPRAATCGAPTLAAAVPRVGTCWAARPAATPLGATPHRGR